MSEFGHNAISGPGFFADGWGRGPYILRTSDKTFRFEDSDRFGPVPIGLDGEPTDEGLFPANSKFWRAYERWKKEGRRAVRGRQGRHGLRWLHCQFSDLRKDEELLD